MIMHPVVWTNVLTVATACVRHGLPARAPRPKRHHVYAGSARRPPDRASFTPLMAAVNVAKMDIF
jgi:hypothetical protein